MTHKARGILVAGGPDAYTRALAALREDTRSYWRECLTDPPDDGLTYRETAEARSAWIEHHWRHWYEEPIAELEHRNVIREQAIGRAYIADHLDMPARYEVHLDRKLERTLPMLIRLKDLRQATVVG